MVEEDLQAAEGRCNVAAAVAVGDDRSDNERMPVAADLAIGGTTKSVAAAAAAAADCWQ